MLRELKTVRNWQNYWVRQNGFEPLQRCEVIIKDFKTWEELYVGNFVGVDLRLLDKEVVNFSHILAGRHLERLNAYELYVE